MPRLSAGVRLFVYSFDAISVRLAVEKALRSGADLVIFDRYIYDEFANLTLHNPAIRAYIRLVMTFIPKPDISYLLDADPVKARARKPEYPIEFLQSSRQAYLALNDLVGGMTVIAPMPVQEVERAVLRHAREHLSFRPPQRENEVATASRDYSGERAELNRPQTRPAAS